MLVSSSLVTNDFSFHSISHALPAASFFIGESLSVSLLLASSPPTVGALPLAVALLLFWNLSSGNYPSR